MLNHHFRLASVALAAGLVSIAPASLLFDRGLPTANLNNISGANRSNVAWGDASGGFSGDDFQLSNAAPAYTISGIRTWLITGDNYDQGVPFSSLISSLQLWLAPAGGANAVSATGYSFTATRVTYPTTSTTYQGGSGALRSLWQIDWSTPGLTLAGGTLYNFGVSGTTVSGGTTIFNHASNDALDGVTSQGADNLVNFWNATGTGFTSLNTLGNGWDKSSDINVQITGEPVPEPATLALGLAGLAAAVRRRRARR